MKAIAIDGYGGADRLRYCERPDPVAGPGQLLVRVRAAGVNPVDWKIRRGDLRVVLRITFPYIPGGDIAGEVVQVGAGVTRFHPGDRVVAFVDLARGGGYAELAVVEETATALLPDPVGFAAAASLPIAAGTALQALRDKGGLRTGGSALITGGAGGVGHFGIQIARALGAAAAATCGPSNIEFVRSLGADPVIDYTKEDFTRRPGRYDVVLDAVATSSFGACRRLLTPGGAYVTTLPSAGLLCWAGAQRALTLFGPAKRATFLVVKRDGADLAYLGRLAESGQLIPNLDRRFPLASARQAHETSETGHTRGKIVLEM